MVNEQIMDETARRKVTAILSLEHGTQKVQEVGKNVITESVYRPTEY